MLRLSRDAGGVLTQGGTGHYPDPAAGGPGQHGDHTAAVALARGTDREVVDPQAVEVTRRQGAAEAVLDTCGSGHSWTGLTEQHGLLAAIDAGPGPVKDSHGATERPPRLGLTGYADREVPDLVVVEVTVGQLKAEQAGADPGAEDTRGGEGLSSRGAEAPRSAVEDDHPPGVPVLTRGRCREVGAAVTVEVREHAADAEVVVLLADSGDPCRVLAEHLVVGGGARGVDNQTACLAVEDVHCAASSTGLADSHVGVPISVDVARHSEATTRRARPVRCPAGQSAGDQGENCPENNNSDTALPRHRTSSCTGPLTHFYACRPLKGTRCFRMGSGP